MCSVSADMPDECYVHDHSFYRLFANEFFRCLVHTKQFRDEFRQTFGESRSELCICAS